MSFSILWTPASKTDAPPNNASTTWFSQCSLVAAGTGMAELTNSSGVLLEMDSTNNLPSGATATLYALTTLSPVVLQANGTYLASGAINSDTLTTDYNSGSGAETTATEYFTVGDIEASN
jgi:hypothetical protein